VRTTPWNGTGKEERGLPGGGENEKKKKLSFNGNVRPSGANTVSRRPRTGGADRDRRVVEVEVPFCPVQGEPEAGTGVRRFHGLAGSMNQVDGGGNREASFEQAG